MEDLHLLPYYARRLSENTCRSEKSAVRGQVFVDLRANSIAICQKYTEICAEQTILQ